VTPPDPEASYYQAVEEFFVSRRGDPLLLSNADWLLIRKWRTAGIPLRVVLRGIADALDSHAFSWSRDRKVGSLAYCAREVDTARERWARSLALGAEIDLNAVLRGFAADLERARGLGRAGQRVARELAQDLRSRAAGEGLEGVEAWLGRREALLLEAIKEDAGQDLVAHLWGEVEGALAPYRERLPARVLDQIRTESQARRLLETHGLPRLSLFHAVSAATTAPWEAEG
jgi:hypothetical protein